MSNIYNYLNNFNMNQLVFDVVKHNRIYILAASPACKHTDGLCSDVLSIMMAKLST